MKDIAVTKLKPIEKLKALVQMGIPFEEAYIQCWKDLRVTETASKHRNSIPDSLHKELEAKPKPITKDKLSEPAKIVNNMLNRGMKIKEISDILGKSHQSVSQLVKKYCLPIQ